MAYESLGNLSEAAIKALKDAKVLMIVRGTEVHIESSEHERAMKIISEIKNPKENVYRFHGFTIKVPRDLAIDSKWYAVPPTNLPIRHGRIHILEYSRPPNGINNDKSQYTIETVRIKGEKIDINASAFRPAFAGVVMCDDDGIPLFEITPWNIFVLFDPRANETATRKIYEANMLTFAIILANHKDEKSVTLYNEIWEKQGGEREKYELEQFKESVLKSIKSEIKDTEQQIKGYEQEIVRARKLIHTYTISVIEAEKRLKYLKDVSNTSAEKHAKEEWEKIKALERNGSVSKIRISSDRISFTTREIKWMPPKLPYIVPPPNGTGESLTIDEAVPLGRFDVTVCTTPGYFSIEINNITKVLSYDGDTWHHPHIKEGSICRGNMSEAVPQFAARKEFEAVIMCILKWLGNIDIKDNWGKNIYIWWKDYLSKRKKEEPKKAENKAAAEAQVQVTA